MILGSKDNIGDVIVQLRTNQGMTRGDLARAAGVHLRTLGRIEKNEYETVQWELVMRILRGMKINVSLTYRGPEDED